MGNQSETLEVLETDLGGRGEKIISEPHVGFLQVGLDASWRFNGHLGTILQNRHRELIAGKTCEPQAEVLVHLYRKRDRFFTWNIKDEKALCPWLV